MLGKFTTASLIIVTALAQEPARTAWDGIYSASQAEMGMHRYTGPCASCHGRALEGAHIFGSRTRTAPALRGAEFLSRWTGHSVGDLLNEISAYMPLDHPNSLSDEANASILAFILRENGFPAGSHDLPPDVAALKTIQITAKK